METTGGTSDARQGFAITDVEQHPKVCQCNSIGANILLIRYKVRGGYGRSTKTCLDDNNDNKLCISILSISESNLCIYLFSNGYTYSVSWHLH